MTSPTVQTTNDENTATLKPLPMAAPAMPNRRVLGDVSPNVRVAAPIADLLKKKPMAGSPLKRSFTAMMEDGAGFTYLKKRRSSSDKLLSQGDGSQSSTRSVFSSREHADPTTTRTTPVSLSPPAETETHSVPAIQQLSPTEPNTPSDSGDGTQDSSAERRSFSSLINYDPSSQTSNIVLKSKSRAEVLKLRLRVAMFKVRTNQVDVPFEKLQVDDDDKSTNKRATPQAVEEAVAELRREAREHMERQSLNSKPIPKLLPAPVLLPTAYSSRMIYGPAVPSSPPALGSPERHSHPRGNATPHRAGRQLSSPPDRAERETRGYEPELTSSVVKGRVAEGLLGLRNAV